MIPIATQHITVATAAIGPIFFSLVGSVHNRKIRNEADAQQLKTVRMSFPTPSPT